MTDIVDRATDGTSDPREHTRVCRLTSKGTTLSLELVERPGHHEAQVHVLATRDWTDRDRTMPLALMKVLDRQIQRVIVSRGSYVYYFPKSQTAPACEGAAAPPEYRLTRINMVYPAYDACKDCVGHAKPVALEPVTCPDCSKLICEGVFQRLEAGAVEGLSVNCPRCGFDGVASVAIDDAARTEEPG